MHLGLAAASAARTATVDWAFVGDMIAAVSLGVTIIGLIVAIVALIKQLRTTYSVENVWHFRDEWESRNMVVARGRLAQWLVATRHPQQGSSLNAQEKPRSEWVQVVSFLTTLDWMIRRKAIQAEATWALL